MSSPFCQIFSSPGKLFHLSNFFPHHTGKISSANLQDFLNFPSQPKFPQSEGQLPPSGACTLPRFIIPCSCISTHQSYYNNVWNTTAKITRWWFFWKVTREVMKYTEWHHEVHGAQRSVLHDATRCTSLLRVLLLKIFSEWWTRKPTRRQPSWFSCPPRDEYRTKLNELANKKPKASGFMLSSSCLPTSSIW